MGTEVESGSVRLPKIADSPFLVNQNGREDASSEQEDLEEDSERQANFANKGGRGSIPRSHGSAGNDSFVPKTLTAGSAPRPSGEARQFAERRIQHEEIFRDPKARRATVSDKSVPKRPTNAQPQSQHDDDLQSRSTLRRDSADSGVASADKTATTAESSSSVHNSSVRSKSDRSQSKRKPPSKSHPAASEPSQRKPSLLLARDDSGLLSTHSESPQYPPPAGKALVYDKQGNLILRDRQVESGMSDPVSRKPMKTDDQLKRIYFANTMKKKKTKEEKKAREAVERREEVILTRREAQKWDDIHNVYGSRVEAGRKRRHNKFMTKLEMVQLEQARRHNQEIIDKNLRALETQKRQQDQLWRLRNRFDEEQRERFYNQWVTMKNLQHEKCDRHVYGLPEEVFGEPEHQAKLKRKKDKLVEKFDFSVQRKKNAERFKHYLNINAGANFDSNTKMPKVEPPNNLDVNVKTHSGKIWKDDEKKLKDIINEAKREIKEVDSPRAAEKAAEPTTPRQRPDPGKKKAPAVKAKSSQPQPDFLPTYGQKKPLPAPKKQEKKAARPPPPPLPKQGRGQGARITKVGAGAFKIGNRRGPRQEVLEYEPRKAMRRAGSDTSLNTVDFLKEAGDEKELDAFERARIKYNLAVDSDEDSVA